MESYEKLYEHVDCELDKIANDPKGLNDVSLQNLYKLVDIKKDLLEIEKKEYELDEMEMMDGMSQAGSYRGRSRRGGGGNSRYGNAMRRGGSRRMGESYDGGYSYYDGYSMAPAVSPEMETPMAHLEEAMRVAKTEAERETIRQAMSRLYK